MTFIMNSEDGNTFLQFKFMTGTYLNKFHK